MKKRLLKNKSIIASLLIVALAFTELPWLAADAHAQTSSQITIHQPLSELSLKESLGKIATKSLSKENPHHVVVIQNAHAIAAAQISITKILKTLNENYGVKLVTLEGASERLDGLFFKTFPEKEVMKKVLNHYLDQGELAGAAASLLLNNEEMIYEGVENQDFYFKNIEVFMQALKKQSSLREAEKKIAEDLSKFKNQFFSPELKRLDSTEQHFRQDAIDLLHYLSILAEYKGEDTEKKYPLLAALWASLEKSDITFEEQKIEEIEKISSQISSRLNLHEEQKEFHAQKQQYETERQSSESFLGYLLAVAKRNKIQVTLSQKLKQSLQLHQRLEKVEGEKLYQEIETYVSAVKSDLFRNQKEKNLNLLTMRLSVLSKNIDFELNRKEWRQVLLQKSNDLDQIDVEFKALKNSLLQLEEEVYGETSPFHQFYALAQKREKALFENMKKSLAKHHQKNTAIVLGGFHTEGFVEFLKKENFSFDVIVPKIEKIENDDQYVQQMGGNVSWKNFLKVENEKIDVREAFNHAVMKKALLEKENKTTFRRGEFLKSWRDEMLREVVREGKASHASRYTHFMDDYFLRDLDHHELKKLREDWSRQVNQFTEKLKGAYESKQFSVEQVRALFNAPALESWVTLLSFTGEKVPAHWLVADLVTEAEVVSPSLSIPNLSARVSELEERAVSGRAELRRKVKVDQEEAEMSGGFIVKAPESWSSVRDVFVYEKGNLYPKRVDFKPNYEPLSMDVRDQLSEISEWDSVSGAARWSQKVSDPEKSQKIVIGVPTHDSSRGRLIYSQLEYFGELAKQIEKAKTAKPNWDIELVINVNGLNQESYLEDLRAFQQASDVSIVLLSMPFGGNVHDDPSPGKGNAVEMIRQYALESNADIVGLLDDDVTYLDRTQDNLAVESDSHLLSNLEFLIEQTRQNQSPVLVGSQYQKEYPKTLWRKFVKEPLTASGANQIRGISMFTFLDALPAMPSFPVNEDLYLTFYFRDVENAQNSLWRILSNPAAPVSFRTAGNFFSDYRQNYRWQLGDMWLFQLTYGAKRKFIHAQYGLSLFVQNIQILFSPWFWFRKVFINHLVGAELLVRQISGRPRMTTRWAQSVPEETKQRSELRSGEKLSPEEVVEARIVDFQRLRHELLGVFSDYRIKKSAGENLDAEKFLVKARRYGQILDPYIAEIRGINPTEKGELAYIVRRRNDGAWLKEEADDLGKNIDVYTQYFIEAYQADDKDRLDRLNEEVLNLLKRRLKIQLIRLQNELAKESINQGPLFLYFMSITNVYKRIAYEHLWREIRAGKNKEIARRFEMVDASGYLVSNLPYEQKPVLRFETDAKGKVQLTQIIWKYVEVEGGVRALQPILTPLNFEDFEEVFKNREKVAANIEEDYRQLKYHGHALESVKQTLLWYKDSGPMPEKTRETITGIFDQVVTGSQANYYDHTLTVVSQTLRWYNDNGPMPDEVREKIMSILDEVLTGPQGKLGLRLKRARVVRGDQTRDLKSVSERDILPHPGPLLTLAKTHAEHNELKQAVEAIEGVQEWIKYRREYIEVKSRPATQRKRDYAYLLMRDSALRVVLEKMEQAFQKAALKNMNEAELQKDFTEISEMLQAIEETYFRFIVKDRDHPEIRYYRQFEREVSLLQSQTRGILSDLKMGASTRVNSNAQGFMKSQKLSVLTEAVDRRINERKQYFAQPQTKRSELRGYVKAIAKKISDNTAPFTLGVAGLYVSISSFFLDWINKNGLLEVWAYGVGGSALVGLMMTQAAKAYMASSEDSSKRSELRTDEEDPAVALFQEMNIEDMTKIFRNEASTFIWRVSASNVVQGVSAPGLPGLIEALRLLDLRTDTGEESLDYHILQSQWSEGDLFPYIFAHLDQLSPKFDFMRQKITALKEASLSQRSNEKIKTNREALAYLDGQFEKMAGVLFEKYFLEKDAAQMKRFERALENKNFRRYVVRYLKTKPNAELLDVDEEGISLFSIQYQGENYLVPINVNAVAYPDPDDHNITKAWARIVEDQSWDRFLDRIGFQNNGFIYQMVDAQTGAEYRSYRPLDFKHALDFGVHQIQILKVKAQVSSNTMRLARAIQSPQFVTDDIQKFINEVIAKVDSPAELKTLLSEIASYKKQDAENIYGKDKVSSIMAFVTFLIPELLEEMSDWNQQTYQSLKGVVSEKQELFKDGKIQFHRSSKKNILIISRMHGRERMILGVPFAYDAVSLHGNVPKVWPSISEFEKLRLQGGSLYRFKDPIAQKTYPLKHFGSDLLERGHRIGIPVITDKFDTPQPNYPVGFQILELEHLRLNEGISPAHDMQIQEINAREFLEVDGEDVAKRRYRSFDDVSDEEIASWKEDGYNTIWMMGIWVESNNSRIINQRWESKEGRGRVASAFSTLDYVLNPRFGNSDLFAEYDQAIVEMRSVLEKPGDDSDRVKAKAAEATAIYNRIIQSEEFRKAIKESEEAFIRFVERAKAKGIRILVDFIPNHLSADSLRIPAQPGMFIHLNHPPNEDMKDFFYDVELPEGRKIWVAHGKDGSAWADTAQLNLENAETWRFFKETIDNFVRYTEGGGVRIDSLQVLKPEVYWGIWKHQLQSKTFEEFNQKLSDNVQEVFGKRPEFTNNPFEVLHAYAREIAPDFKTVGEVYHGQHPHWQNAGVDVTYAKYSYKWLVDEKDQNWHAFKDHVLRRGPHAGLSAQYLYRSSYLLEDHDERKRVLEALLERSGISIEDEVQKVINKAWYYRNDEQPQEDRTRQRQELIGELKIDSQEIIDRALEAGVEYWNAEEASDQQRKARTKIVLILLEKAITPTILNWSKLLATMIAVIPGVTITYDGQRQGKVRLISSADWIPPHDRRDEEVEREDLKAFYRELHRRTSTKIFRRGEVPVRIPLKGIEGGELPQILAFSRTYGNTETIVVLNHSQEPIQITLDLTHLGFGEKQISLEAWGSSIETLTRSELRSEEEISAAYKKAFSGENSVTERLPDIRNFALVVGKATKTKRLMQDLPSDPLELMTVMIEEIRLLGGNKQIAVKFAQIASELTYDAMLTYTLESSSPEVHRKLIEKSSILQPLLLSLSDEIHFRMLLVLSIAFDSAYGMKEAKKDLIYLALLSERAKNDSSTLESVAELMKLDRLLNLASDPLNTAKLKNLAEDFLKTLGDAYLYSDGENEHRSREYKNYLYELALLHMRVRTEESIRRAIEITDQIVKMDDLFLAAHFLGLQLRDLYVRSFQNTQSASFLRQYQKELKPKKKAYLKALKEKVNEDADYKNWENLFIAQQYQASNKTEKALAAYQAISESTTQFDLSFIARYNQASLGVVKAINEGHFRDVEKLESHQGLIETTFDLFQFMKNHEGDADRVEAMTYYILHDNHHQSRHVSQLAIHILQSPKLWPKNKEILKTMYRFVISYGGLNQESKSLLLSNILDSQFFHSRSGATDWEGLKIILESAYSLDSLRTRRQIVMTIFRKDKFSEAGKELISNIETYLDEKIKASLEMIEPQMHHSLFMGTAIDRLEESLPREDTKIVLLRRDVAETILQDTRFDMLQAEKRIKDFEAKHVTLKGWKNSLPLQFYRIFIRSMITYLSDQTDKDLDPKLVENVKKFVSGFAKRNKDLMEVLNEQAQSLSIHFELGILADAVKDYVNSFEQLQRFFQKTLDHVSDNEYASKKISSYSAALEPIITAAVFLQKNDARFHYTQILNRELLYEWNEIRQQGRLDESKENSEIELEIAEQFLEKFEDFQWNAWLYLRSKRSPLQEFIRELIPFLARALSKMKDLDNILAVMNLSSMLGEEELLASAAMRFIEVVPVEEIQVGERLRVADLLGMAYASLAKRGQENANINTYIEEILKAEEDTEITESHREYLLFFKAKQKFYKGEYAEATKILTEAALIKAGDMRVDSFHLRGALLNLLQGNTQRALDDLRLTMKVEKDFEKKGWSLEELADRQIMRNIFFFTISREDQNKMIDLYIKVLLTDPLKAFQIDEIIENLSLLNEDYFYRSFLLQAKEMLPDLTELPQHVVLLFQKINFPDEHLVSVYELLLEMSVSFEKSAKNLRKQIEGIENRFQADDLIELAKKSFEAAEYDVAARYLDLLRKKRIPENRATEVAEIKEKVSQAKALRKQIKELMRKQGDPTELVGFARQLIAINPQDKEARSLAGLSDQFEQIKDLLVKGDITQAKKTLGELFAADPENQKLRRQSKAFDEYDEAIKKVAELLEDKRYQSATAELDRALKTLAESWDLESTIPQTETAMTKLGERISAQEAEVTLHRDAMRANGSLREVFRHAEDLVNYPEHIDEVYAHLIETGVKKFDEALAFQSPHEKVKREALFKMAFNYGRLILEIMSEREVIVKYEKAAQSLISQSAAQIWLPKFKNDYFMVAAMVEAEEKRDIIDREEMGKPTDGPLAFSFSNFEIAPNGKTFKLKQFLDKQIYNHLWRGDTFKIELLDGTELQPFFKLVAFTNDFLEFEMPETSEAKEEVLKILSQVRKDNQGKITRARNSSWVIQRGLLASIVEGLDRSTKQKLAFDFKDEKISFETATTGNRMLDQILGLNISIRSVGEKVYRSQQKAIINSLLDEKALAEGYDLDPSQREGIIEVLLGVTPFVFLQGPPGTGKTTATVWQTELLMQLKKRIRILSQTNPGADNVVRRLKAKGREVVRVGNNEDAIDPDLLPDWSQRKEALKALAKKQEQGEATVIAGTINGLPTDRYLLQWSSLRDADVVETDEASRATRAESILATSWFNRVTTKVFVGDHIQLPAHGLTDEDVKFAREYLSRKIKGRMKKPSDPGVDARLSGQKIVLASSFGERSFDEVFSSPNVKGFKISLMEEALRLYFPNHEDVLSPENFFKVTRPAFFFFDVQRRSGTDIVKLINYFYHGRLKAGRDTRGLVIEDNTEGLYPESRDAQEGDITNSGEVYRVIHWVNDLMNEKKLEAKDIAIISPYKKQVAEIDLALLDFATLHSFLKSFEEKGVMEGAEDASFALKNSRAIKNWLLEKEIQKMKATEGRFDLSRAKQRAEEKIELLLEKMRGLRDKPSQTSIEAFREMLGLGENFVTLKDIREFKLRTLTVDSSIGQEFKAVILSWVRSNLKNGNGNIGNAGFMADPIDGMRRVNVATSRAQDILINIWDRQTFVRNKDADVRNWANHTAKVFEGIRKDPVEWDARTQSVRNEIRDQSLEKASAKRSELREIVQPALVALASHDRGDVALQAARQLVAGVEQHDLEALLKAMLDESQRARYLRILKQGYDGDERMIRELEIESGMKNKHRRHDLNIQEYLSDYLEQMKTYFKARLTDPSDPLKQLNFSFAFELDNRIETQKVLLEYVRMVEDIKKLEYTQDVKITADIRLMLSESAKKQLSASFRSAIEETRIAHFFELQDNALTGIHMDDYFKKNPQALAYLFSDRSRSLHHGAREVHSRFEALNTLPVALMMTNFMAGEQIEELSDDYLLRLPHRLPYPDAITYNGQNLEVTSQALELIYQIQARELIATMA